MGIDMSRPASLSQQICQEGHLLIHMKMDIITTEDKQQNLTFRCSLCDTVLKMIDVGKLINHPVVTAIDHTSQNSQTTNQTDTNTSARESSFVDFAQDFTKTELASSERESSSAEVAQDFTKTELASSQGEREDEISERESNFNDFAVKTELVSLQGDCEDDIGLDMHVESYESVELDLGNKQENSAANSNQMQPLTNDTEAGTSSVQQIVSDKRKSNANSAAISNQMLPLTNVTEAGTSSVQHIVSDKRKSNAPSGYKEPLSKFCKSTEDRAVFQCRVSGCDKVFSSMCALQKHSRTHTGIYPFNCLECNKGFHSKSKLEDHKRANHTEEKFHCLRCDKTVSTLQGLKLHDELHGEKVHQCHVCEKSFSSRTYLSRHLRTHIACYDCKLCDKSYSSQQHLKIHMATHSDKTFTCSKCTFKTHYNHSYVRHLKTHERDPNLSA